VGQGLATVQSALGTMIADAIQLDNVALDGEGRTSPFTAALLKHLATPGDRFGDAAGPHQRGRGHTQPAGALRPFIPDRRRRAGVMMPLL
jgi:hypothetical protein